MLPEFCAEAHKKIAVSTPSRATAAKDSIANPNAPLVIRAPSTCVLKLFANPLDAVRIQKIIPVTKPTAIKLIVPAKNFSANSVNDSEVSATPIPKTMEKITAVITPVQTALMRLRRSIFTK